MTESPTERYGVPPPTQREGVPPDEDISSAQVEDQLDTDPEEVPNAPNRDPADGPNAGQHWRSESTDGREDEPV
ncbi:MAG: hypothetical protein ACR2KG_12475 [Nocardioidaceae bacterium]